MPTAKVRNEEFPPQRRKGAKKKEGHFEFDLNYLCAFASLRETLSLR